ncbi:CobW family GTP-binding protein [Deinococcus cellulosilyticus]|uniref:GTP-binding protein n=1 Tax=Deinococcus cellulosilyticus (strain DSM 18568 / NBRC 106333 / KACC 11606 / 5516J-15) TaxID=1223518 RepID=A0A511N686_DEIC1|nr:GTP-binding protein [Deinococcus cellulosilyticus]GEM47967.1 GTP-binding protein [Deinococcus cellulosilyticus NBRC 106333 = KACC 11606]
MSSIPVTVLCGFLGSGKTTLLNHLLSQSKDRKIAVIVNEFGEINIDASTIVHTDEKTIELSNGCICCTLRGDLLEAVDDLLKTRELDHIVIESTGIGEPLPIAQSFCLTPEELDLDPGLPNLLGKVHIDAMVTVVDAAQFFEMYHRPGTIEGDDLERGYGQLLQEQLEFANLVVLNKLDVATPEDVQKLEEFIALTNPRAKVLKSIRGVIPIEDILSVELFDFEEMSQLDSWMLELEKEHTPESETYGLGTYIYRTQAPLDLDRLYDILEQGLPRNIIRSKGWLNTGSDVATLWNHTGRFLTLEPMGEWNNPAEAFTELVFIGQDLDGAEIEDLLSSALTVLR